MKIKKIAVLTSGGDAPGMNSTLFGLYNACSKNNIKLLGVIGGYDGLIDNKFMEIKFDTLDGRINRGGSIIKSSRSPRFLKDSHFKKAIENINANKIDALVIIGGDGSVKGAIKLREAGIKIIALPATIDNDLNFSHTIGFDSASNNIVNAVDNISDSLYAFGYGAVIKIMGRDCSDLINCAADAIHTDYVINTKNYNINNLIKQIKQQKDKQHLPFVVLVLEDCIDCNELAKTLQEKCKIPFRPHILGYIQRGGTPSAYDRRYGYSAGIKAIDSIMRGETGFTIGMEKDELTKKSFEDTIKKYKKPLTE